MSGPGSADPAAKTSRVRPRSAPQPAPGCAPGLAHPARPPCSGALRAEERRCWPSRPGRPATARAVRDPERARTVRRGPVRGSGDPRFSRFPTRASPRLSDLDTPQRIPGIFPLPDRSAADDAGLPGCCWCSPASAIPATAGRWWLAEAFGAPAGVPCSGGGGRRSVFYAPRS